MAVEMKREQRLLPTYEPAAPNELPFFLEKKAYQGATGRVYPIPYTDRLSNEPVEKPYDMTTLSNEYNPINLTSFTNSNPLIPILNDFNLGYTLKLNTVTFANGHT